MKNFRHIEWDGAVLRLLDQRKLPLVQETVECRSYQEVADAIKSMVIRGAPAIAVAAAYGMAMGAAAGAHLDGKAFFDYFNVVAETLRNTRPTAVNLFWAIDRMLNTAEKWSGDGTDLVARLEQEAKRIQDEDIEINRRIGRFGAELLADGDHVLTHCNAGALATAGYGTALGVIRAAVEEGKRIAVYADETRPFLQGSRLTAWELQADRIPVTLISDSMAGWVMRTQRVQAVVVGADRIAANGDVANKIGTYSVAQLAQANGVPFYVAAPMSTIDLKLATGDEIPIEERNPDEVTSWAGRQVAPEGVAVFNPAFDVTPHELISAIITDKGIAYSPYDETLAALTRRGDAS